MAIAGIHRNKFTAEQVEILRSNPYVRSVSIDAVSFTTEFKEEFWRMYTEEDIAPYDILFELGIDYHILGSSRVQGIANYIKKQHKRDGCFKKDPNARTHSKPSLNQEIAQLRAEVEYLKQEREFLKKITMAEKRGKSK